MLQHVRERMAPSLETTCSSQVIFKRDLAFTYLIFQDLELLLVFIPPSDASGGGGFFFSGTAPFPVDVTLQYQGGDGSPTQLILSHMVKAIVTDPDDQSVATIGNGGNFVLGIAAVPEASSALLLGVVSLGGAAVAIGRRAIRS
jgi:hypothetical protein